MASPFDLRDWPPLRLQGCILGGLVVLLWLVHWINVVLFDGQLMLYGIRPRHLVGLPGILWAPWLHGSWNHLLTNTLLLIPLAGGVLWQTLGNFWGVTVTALLTSGLGIWLLGTSTSVHVGASGVVFGYLGYLLLRKGLKRQGPAIALAGVAVCGSVLGGVLLSSSGLSWEGHLCGLLGGALAAWQRPRQPPAATGQR